MKQISYITLCACSALLFFSALGSDFVEQSALVVIPQACQENIDAHKERVTSMMTRDQRLRMLFQSCLVVGCGYVAYKTIEGFWKGDTLPPLPKGNIDEGLLARYGEVIRKAFPKMLSFQWWKNQAGFFVNHIVLSTVLTSAIAFGRGKVYHDDTIVWFAEQKTHLGLVRNLLTGYAARLNGKESLSEQDCTRLKVMLSTVGKQLISQAELLAGFMEYQLEQFKNRGAYLEGDEILQVTGITAQANQFVTNLNGLLADENLKTAEQLKKPLGVALQFVVDLGQQIKRFTTIELCIESRLMNGGLDSTIKKS